MAFVSYPMVATATRSVSGIERESAIISASLEPEIFRNTTAAKSLESIMSAVMSSAP